MAQARAGGGEYGVRIAGPTTVVAGSPSPVGTSVLGLNSMSISGTSPIRSGV
jgi:hypothetical protein